jgi:hypothetical protein
MNCYSEQKPIRMMEIRNRAKMLGIHVSIKMSRVEMIHRIQLKEGNRMCFKTEVLDCRRFECCWFHECQERI